MFDRLANVRQWRTAARRFLRATSVETLRDLAKLYEYDTFPLRKSRLFRQARHPQRGWAVMKVLGTLDTPAVRRFALGLLHRRPLPWNALEALYKTFRPGDEPLVLAAVQSLNEASNMARHNASIDVEQFLEQHPKGRWQPHAEWIIEHAPSANSRLRAVRWMHEHGTIPAAFLEEAPYDAEPDIRDIAKSIEREAL